MGKCPNCRNELVKLKGKYKMAVQLHSEEGMKRTKRIEISNQIFTELNKISRFRLLFFLQEHGETKVYPLAKKFGWASAKMHGVIKNLVKSKLIQIRYDVNNGRVCTFIKLNE